ncbi:hypothetical protein AB0C61_15075 [Streptomyces sp. NPDC048680]|uniref:hypothetical protein n=1 Tax=Streptomyces sp. NPDC048680 TaxID=3155492 RepID=UPI00341498D1
MAQPIPGAGAHRAADRSPRTAPQVAPPMVFDGAAELVGRTFATALQEGLGRVSPPWMTAAAPGGPVRPGGPPAPSAVLLRDHREEILTRLAGALPAAMRAAGQMDAERAIPALLAWARARLFAATAAGLPRPGARNAPLPFPRLELTVATLLLESAAGVLPDLPARDRALRDLGHAVRHR